MCLQPEPIEKLVSEKYNKKDNYTETNFTGASSRHTVGVAYVGPVPLRNQFD
jgi:hypothetical protein